MVFVNNGQAVNGVLWSTNTEVNTGDCAYVLKVNNKLYSGGCSALRGFACQA